MASDMEAKARKWWSIMPNQQMAWEDMDDEEQQEMIEFFSSIYQVGLAEAAKVRTPCNDDRYDGHKWFHAQAQSEMAIAILEKINE